MKELEEGKEYFYKIFIQKIFCIKFPKKKNIIKTSHIHTEEKRDRDGEKQGAKHKERECNLSEVRLEVSNGVSNPSWYLAFWVSSLVSLGKLVLIFFIIHTMWKDDHRVPLIFFFTYMAQQN